MSNNLDGVLISDYLLVNPENSSNPYDNYGFNHNLYLDDFANTNGLIAMQNGESREFCNTFLGNHGLGHLSPMQFDSIKVYWDDYHTNYSNSNDILEMYNKPCISLNFRNYYSNLMSTFNLIESPNLDGITIRGVLTSFINNVKFVENNIINDASLTTDEKAVLLISSAVARYSAAYHASRITLTNDVWQMDDSNYDPDETISNEIWLIIGADWGEVAREDFKGGGMGVLALATGIATGGLPLLVGCAGASAMELLAQIVFGDAWLLWV